MNARCFILGHFYGFNNKYAKNVFPLAKGVNQPLDDAGFNWPQKT